MIGRNELCPCGSTKKYKKCCGKTSNVITITQLIDSEIIELQKQIVDYALFHYTMEIEDHFEQMMEVLHIHDDEVEFYTFLHVVWFSLFYELNEGTTVIKQFIESEKGRIKRPKLRQILEGWTSPVILTGAVKKIERNVGIVSDSFTSKEYEVNFLEYNPSLNTFILGMALPVDHQYVFFPMPLELKDVDIEGIYHYLSESYDHSGYEIKQEYIIHHFLDIVTTLPTIGLGIDVEELNWKEPAHFQVAELFKYKMEETGESLENIEIGITTWFAYCQKKDKRVKNPAIYAAALHYMISTNFPTVQSYTQKDLASMYDVNPSSISSVYGDLLHFIHHFYGDEKYDHDDGYYDSWNEEDDMDIVLPKAASSSNLFTEKVLKDAMKSIEGKDFDSIEDITEYLNHTLQQPSFEFEQNEKSDEDLAQGLIYEAFESTGATRYRLAKQALELYPYLPDAYIILAEKEKTVQKKLELYEKAMQIGYDRLGGEKYVQKQKGHFWGLIETRPYMRAKLHVANTLVQLKRTGEAISHYEELLQLNEMDNQGVRYLLFPAYIEAEEYDKANQLLQQFGEHSTHSTYNQLLLELILKGKTKKAEKLLKEAKKANPYVSNYLSGKRKLPKREPDYYSFGDENEAIIYVSGHLHLWNRYSRKEFWN
ncbi:SEC-C metal-binding domain-containing protein [Bacillus salitolerans]|uniref:SEC-C metal-binding domain-containing protein n=1 Tax=Bacillus salitolerans TaxID=1437434 RepID=A0ABW4LWF4_9BACI